MAYTINHISYYNIQCAIYTTQEHSYIMYRNMASIIQFTLYLVYHTVHNLQLIASVRIMQFIMICLWCTSYDLVCMCSYYASCSSCYLVGSI